MISSLPTAWPPRYLQQHGNAVANHSINGCGSIIITGRCCGCAVGQQGAYRAPLEHTIAHQAPPVKNDQSERISWCAQPPPPATASAPHRPFPATASARRPCPWVLCLCWWPPPVPLSLLVPHNISCHPSSGLSSCQRIRSSRSVSQDLAG